AEPVGLERALHNLLSNARKHAASGGWVRLSVQAVPAGHPREIAIRVEDRGPGLDPADAGHLFEPFFRGRRAVEEQVPGSGLGLSLVRRLVEAQGGRVAAESRAGAGPGAAFTIHLPLAPEPGPRTAPAVL